MTVWDGLFFVGMLLVAGGIWLAGLPWLAIVFVGVVCMVLGAVGAWRESERTGD